MEKLIDTHYTQYKVGKRVKTFDEFWPIYLAAHRHPTCRLLHYLGTFASLLGLLVAIFSRNFWPLLLVPIMGYGPAWIGHFFIERNRPATFQHPWWSFKGDFKMLRLALKGQIGQEINSLFHSHGQNQNKNSCSCFDNRSITKSRSRGV